MTANMFADSTGSAYGLAPPPQSLIEDLQITFDTEMMDEDEVLAMQQLEQQHNDNTGLVANGVSVGFDTASGMGMEMGMETDTVQITAEKVHLRGVDTMATGDIEAWERKWVGEDGGIIKVQWIDDSSCNLIYPSAEHAHNALNLLTDPSPPHSGGITQPTPAQQADFLLIRTARFCEAYPNSKLEVRIARVDDVKQKGARERSRFYLFNPEYDRGEEFEKRRRDRGHREPRRDRDGSPADGDGYTRRRFDRREHDRRIAGGADYNDNMYDDEARPSSGARPRPRPQARDRSPTRSRSGSRSRYHSRHRSRSPPRWRSRSARRSRSAHSQPPKKNIELFPGAVNSEPKGLMGHHGEDRFYNPPSEIVSRVETVEKVPTRAIQGVELFPEMSARGTKNILGLAAGSGAGGGKSLGKELFPETGGSTPPPGDLASRISLPGRGVLGYHSDDTGAGEEDAPRERKAKKVDDDLFAEKMVMGRRVGAGRLDLFDRIEIPGDSGSGTGSSSGRKRGRRNKAADLFG